MNTFFQWIKAGKPWIWLTGSAVAVSLISVFGLLLLIGWKGLIYFWPAPLTVWHSDNGSRIVGQVYQRASVPISHLPDEAKRFSSQITESESIARLNIKIANRDIYQVDFISVLEPSLGKAQYPSGWAVIERDHNGVFFGKPIAYVTAAERYTSNIQSHLKQGVTFASTVRSEIKRILNDEVRVIGWELSQLSLAGKKAEADDKLNPIQQEDNRKQENRKQENNNKKIALESAMSAAEAKLERLRTQLEERFLIVEDMAGETYHIPLNHILDAWYPNDMNLAEKAFHWLKQLTKFILENPREVNSEGGIFPAIFGTVFLVLIMSIIVTPLGVLAAIYLHEYAGNNLFTTTLRVAIINLAGVPSIVYGVFGLGFFVYTIGGSIDSFFYADKLPTPTFGTPGILWAALTLALLTLPVVIISTEEGLSRIPMSVRSGSYALGATQFETLRFIVLPMASPAIITGLILAVARAAGEVAPLMLVGVAKLAPSLPVDGNFPYVHLERKFMHLGYHIYDVGFQAPNIEAARPLVYATALLLVIVVVVLNLTAINIRNNLTEKYHTLRES